MAAWTRRGKELGGGVEEVGVGVSVDSVDEGNWNRLQRTSRVGGANGGDGFAETVEVGAGGGERGELLRSQPWQNQLRYAEKWGFFLVVPLCTRAISTPAH